MKRIWAEFILWKEGYCKHRNRYTCHDCEMERCIKERKKYARDEAKLQHAKNILGVK